MIKVLYDPVCRVYREMEESTLQEMLKNVTDVKKFMDDQLTAAKVKVDAGADKVLVWEVAVGAYRYYTAKQVNDYLSRM